MQEDGLLPSIVTYCTAICASKESPDWQLSLAVLSIMLGRRPQDDGGQIHWFSILNSLMIMLFLLGMVAMILLRTLYRDITKYNELALPLPWDFRWDFMWDS